MGRPWGSEPRSEAAVKTIEQLSLGWRTHLIFARFDGQVHARADHLLVRTPHNPTFYWGNFLLFDRAPVEGDAASWLAAFDAGITQHQPASTHVAIGIDVPEAFALPADFAAAGVSLSRDVVLTMQAAQLRPLRKALPSGFEVRPLRLPQEASLAADLQVDSDDGGFEPEGYREFRTRQMLRYGRMDQAGLGHWFGVFAQPGARDASGRATLTPQLVADCGLFREGNDEVPGGNVVARFQSVSTHPAWRRLGLCSALIHAVCKHGFEVLEAPTLVILADPDDVAIGLYESLGFERVGSAWQLERRAPPSAPVPKGPAPASHGKAPAPAPP
jgi:RimJ/RimL family protein N-acetyltransferase